MPQKKSVKNGNYSYVTSMREYKKIYRLCK